MSEPNPDSRREPADNPAQIRGDISQGQGGKRPGIDPAAAPLETDAEAGGSGLSSEEVAIARSSQRDATPRASRQAAEGLSYGSAMHEPTSSKRPAATRRRLVAVLVVLAVAVLIIIAVI